MRATLDEYGFIALSSEECLQKVETRQLRIDQPIHQSSPWNYGVIN